MTQVFSSIKTSFVRAFKKNIFNKILKNLKKDFYFNFGHYERCYPDNPRSITKGFFQMEIVVRNSNTYIFQIEAVEGNFRTNTNYLDYYYSFKTEKELWVYIRKFFSKFSNLESLSQAVYRKFGFLHPQVGALLINHYNILKDDLPDGQDFEDFLEDFKSFIR